GDRISSNTLFYVTKTNNASLDNVWTDVFAKALEGKDLKELFLLIEPAQTG
ncbi:hypothetical protein METBIDRAFT_36277, partial [Metschnikowia bicuspidata var. bicuspidata NRRL YB-4993]